MILEECKWVKIIVKFIYDSFWELTEFCKDSRVSSKIQKIVKKCKISVKFSESSFQCFWKLSSFPSVMENHGDLSTVTILCLIITNLTLFFRILFMFNIHFKQNHVHHLIAYISKNRYCHHYDNNPRKKIWGSKMRTDMIGQPLLPIQADKLRWRRITIV